MNAFWWRSARALGPPIAGRTVRAAALGIDRRPGSADGVPPVTPVLDGGRP